MSLDTGKGRDRLSFKSVLDFDCPFCGGKVSMSNHPAALAHTMPMCEKFDKLEPADFIREVNVIFRQKRMN